MMAYVTFVVQRLMHAYLRLPLRHQPVIRVPMSPDVPYHQHHQRFDPGSIASLERCSATSGLSSRVQQVIRSIFGADDSIDSR